MRYIYCHPLFDERKCSHRFSFQLSETFRHNGLKLERFDYHGTGEAEGRFCDVTIRTLRRDIKEKIDSQKASLIGLRLGASLAFDYCCRQSGKVRNLVLVEPIIEGADYVDYLFRKQHIKDLMTGPSADSLEECGFHNLEGYKTNAVLIEQIKQLCLTKMADSLCVTGEIRIVQIIGTNRLNPQIVSLADTLKKAGVNIKVKSFKLPAFWERIPDVDYSILTRKILEWCRD